MKPYLLAGINPTVSESEKSLAVCNKGIYAVDVNQEFENKHCEYCQKQGHSPNECWYNKDKSICPTHGSVGSYSHISSNKQRRSTQKCSNRQRSNSVSNHTVNTVTVSTSLRKQIKELSQKVESLSTQYKAMQTPGQVYEPAEFPFLANCHLKEFNSFLSSSFKFL